MNIKFNYYNLKRKAMLYKLIITLKILTFVQYLLYNKHVIKVLKAITKTGDKLKINKQVA